VFSPIPLYNFFNWAFAGLFGYLIHWWVWALLGLAAAIAVFLLLPALVPERLRVLLAAAAFSIGAIISAGSWGINHGIHTERISWELKVAKERKRLANEAAQQLAAEAERAANAELESLELRKQLDALLNAPAPDPSKPATVTPDGMVVFDEPFVNGLRALGTSKSRARKR
jgi:hypothetical protein